MHDYTKRETKLEVHETLIQDKYITLRSKSCSGASHQLTNAPPTLNDNHLTVAMVPLE